MSKIEVNTVEPQCGTTLTLGASGDTVTIPSGATLSASKVSGVQAVSWQTGSIKTATFTAAAGEGYFCNTSGGAFTVNLPAGSAGAVVAVSDYTRTFQTNNLTVSPNGSEKIGGVAADATLSTEGQTATFVYVDSTEGWINVQETSNSVTGSQFIVATGGTITTSGDFKIHTFTGPGTFCVSQISTVAAENTVSYAVIAGGGAGGSGGNGGGGGGAGGFRENKSPVDTYTASPLEGAADISITATGFPITVGGGGTGVTGSCTPGANGVNSVFSSITSAGGGGGGGPPSSGNGDPGGSGGGGGGATACRTGGSGNTPPVSPPQGQDGGRSSGQPGLNGKGGGGGGAGAAATQTPVGNNNSAGNGAVGVPTAITGSAVSYAGGAGGGAQNGPTSAAGGAASPCGTGGVGATSAPAASPPIDRNAGDGTTNRGGGGGGNTGTSSPAAKAGNGGSGIVIIRYKFQ
jgi:hypothetical protein